MNSLKIIHRKNKRHKRNCGVIYWWYTKNIIFHDRICFIDSASVIVEFARPVCKVWSMLKNYWQIQKGICETLCSMTVTLKMNYTINLRQKFPEYRHWFLEMIFAVIFINCKYFFASCEQKCSGLVSFITAVNFLRTTSSYVGQLSLRACVLQ